MVFHHYPWKHKHNQDYAEFYTFSSTFSYTYLGLCKT